MGFGNPLILWALWALALPIIIHLFNFRRYKKIFFSNVAFLQQATEEGKRKRKLKEYLILVSRLLAFTSIIIAFASPYLKKNKLQKPEEKSIIIAIDNSLSMQSRGKNGILLETAKNKANALLSSIKNNANVLIIANNKSQKRFGSYSKAQKFITELKPQSVPFNFNKTLKKAQQYFGLTSISNKHIFIISDMQKNGFTEQKNADLDSSIFIQLLPLKTLKINNLSIDSAWLDNPIITIGTEIGLHLRANNYSAIKVENVDINLKGLNNNTQGLLSLDINENSSSKAMLKFTPKKAGWNTFKLNINDEGEGFDDDYYLSMHVKPKLNILLLQNQNSALKSNAFMKLYGNNSSLKLTTQNIQNPDYAHIKDYDMIVLNQSVNVSTGLSNSLNLYAKNGGKVCIALPENTKNISLNDYQNFGLNVKKWNKLPESVPLENPDLKDPFFKNTYTSLSHKSIMPWVKGYYNIQAPEYRTVLKTQSEMPIYITKKIGNGSIYVLTGSLNNSKSNLVDNELFVISFLQPLFVGDYKNKLANTIGNTSPIRTHTTQMDREENYIIQGNSTSFIPISTNNGETVKINSDMPLYKQGIYNLLLGKDSLSKIAFNYNRLESNLNSLTSEELSIFGKSENAIILDKNTDELKIELNHQFSKSNIWKWFISLAIFFILIEIILLKMK